jgi:hypothetical protein
MSFIELPPISGGGGGAVDSVNGKTGVVVLVKGDIGLGNVNNTSDLNKPVSTATQTALDLKRAINRNETFTPAGGSGYSTLDSDYMAINPTASSPSQSYAMDSKMLEIDTALDGFPVGVGNQFASVSNYYIKHIGESDIGGVAFIQTNTDIGNGTDPIDVGGVAISLGFSNINANVTLTGPIQGYGFQHNMDSASVMNSYINAFYDFADIDTACGFYQSFACGPQIAEIKNNANYTAFNNNATIPIFTGNAGFNGLAISPTLGTFGTGSFSGVLINPNITSGNYAVGLNVDMSNVTATTKYAATFNGDVSINGALSFSGALSIGKLSAYDSEPVVDGGFNPSTIHGLVTNPTVAANATIANADTIGVNTAMLLQVGDNATVTTNLVGISALALPAVVTMGSGSTVDRVSGGSFALSLDATATGGTIDNLELCRSVAIPNGITTVNNLVGFKFDLPFGDPGTTTWGVYASPSCHNYFAGNLKIGGADTVTNSSVALEIESTTKAFIPSRVTTAQRDALTAVEGMVIHNTDTDSTHKYENGEWVDEAHTAINTQIVNYILVRTDDSKLIRMNVGSANTLTIPPESSVNFPIGTMISVEQMGSGQTTITPGSGVTITSAGSKFKTNLQSSVCGFIKVASDTWTLFGDLVV